MNRWKRTLRKRRKKQRKANEDVVLMFRGKTAAVRGIWTPRSRRPRPPPLEEQGLPNIGKLMEDCEIKPDPPTLDLDALLDDE